jgi:hypothetical protein
LRYEVINVKWGEEKRKKMPSIASGLHYFGHLSPQERTLRNNLPPAQQPPQVLFQLFSWPKEVT